MHKTSSKRRCLRRWLTSPHFRNLKVSEGGSTRSRSGILAKYFRDRYKRRIHEPIDDGVLETRASYAAPTDQQPDNLVIAKEHLEIVQRLGEQLPESEREVFLLKFADPEMPQKEIAKTLRISVDAVKTRWRRGKQTLRKQLEAKYPGEFTYLFK